MKLTCPIRAACEVDSSAVAIVCDGVRLTYGQLEAEVSRWARWLSGRGVLAGHRICVLSHNSPELVALWFGALRLGAALVPLNARLGAAELQVLVELASPRLTLVEDALADRIPGAHRLGAVEAPGAEAIEPTVDSAAIAAVLFTSGTTGRPKGAQLTVGNFVASAEASARRIGGARTDRWLASLSLFHVGGLSMAFRTLQYGATLVLMRRFDADLACSLLERERITHASFVPTTLQRLVELASTRPFAPALRAVLVGGGPVSADLLRRARAVGLPALQTYGLTEACSQVCTESMGDASGGTAGGPLEGVEVRIVDEARRPVAPGVAGEIEVRGPTVMAGYLGATGEPAPDGEGWLRTRDLGSLDASGRLHVYARRTDLILTGGENVYPAELEAVLAGHPAVVDVAVAGVADATWGQVPVAVVAARGEVAESELARWCRERLAGFKVPKRFLAVSAVPRNANGKVDRAALRDLIAAMGSGPTRGHEAAAESMRRTDGAGA